MGAEWGPAQAPGMGSALLQLEHAPAVMTELVPAPRREIRPVVSARDDHLDERLHAPTPETVIVDELVVEGLRRTDLGEVVVLGSADAVLASLARGHG
jgi:hypothetical protein